MFLNEHLDSGSVFSGLRLCINDCVTVNNETIAQKAFREFSLMYPVKSRYCVLDKVEQHALILLTLVGSERVHQHVSF
jgi:hypothetical protein